MSDISAQWLQATLGDAAEQLSEVLAKLEDHPDSETAEDILSHDLVHVYAKLNYAVNSARLGPEALNALSEDELIAWPARMPFLTLEEIEHEGEEVEE
ncbi:hypothetical protein [Sutterella sp.]|uniref:hypothetical protein n=1 Tax=Sutterella sp. TaxID=1981025 RepID=UPI0026DF924C|nr:hypothetical protein [Sutterella sp.]MDO5531389.1 hypothetical protein [Sutterella sp.]